MTDEGVLRVRRYYMRKRVLAGIVDPDAVGCIDAVFRHKQESTPGVLLPLTFPFLSRLQAAGYTTIEDLHGASRLELSEQGFTGLECEVILDELQKLPVPVDPPVLPAPIDP